MSSAAVVIGALRVKTKYFGMNKVYTDEGYIKQLFCGLSPCTIVNPLAKAYELSPRMRYKPWYNFNHLQSTDGWMDMDDLQFYFVCLNSISVISERWK